MAFLLGFLCAALFWVASLRAVALLAWVALVPLFFWRADAAAARCCARRGRRRDVGFYADRARSHAA